MLKIGVLGAGHLGRIHLKLIKEIEGYELVGFYDPDDKAAKTATSEHEVKRFNDISALIDACDVIDIVTPTLSHFDCAKQCLEKGKHIFIEKPVTNTLAEAEELLEILEKNASLKVQVGHVERFNPAFVSAQAEVNKPMFIETHRLAQFNPRGTDVPVVLDLMIHDIDIILSLVDSPVKSVMASGVAVISDSPDIANARISFENGCVANLTASRISIRNMRKTRIFQKDAYISIDFLNKESEIVNLEPADEAQDPFAFVLETGSGEKKKINFKQPTVPQHNAIKEELKSLMQSIKENTDTAVSLRDGYMALKVAHQVIDSFEPHQVELNS